MSKCTTLPRGSSIYLEKEVSQYTNEEYIHSHLVHVGWLETVVHVLCRHTRGGGAQDH